MKRKEYIISYYIKRPLKLKIINLLKLYTIRIMLENIPEGKRILLSFLKYYIIKITIQFLNKL